MKPGLRIVAGLFAGVVLTYAASVAVSLAPTRLEIPRVRELNVPDVRTGNGVTLSFVTTGTARPPGRRLQQGAGLGRHDVAFRAALIQHPRGNVLFGTGVDPGGPGGLIYNPFGRITPKELPELPEVAQVILPTPRWIHMGGLDRWPSLADVPVRSGNGDIWQARSGPWPRRYAMEGDRVRALGNRLGAIGWARRSWFGFSKSRDLYGDGSIIVVALRGSTADEIGAVVTTDSGTRYLLVGDAVWTREQVADLFPRAPWSTWLLDRNRMQLAGTQSVLYALQRDYGMIVVPLLDGSMVLPEYPDVNR